MGNSTPQRLRAGPGSRWGESFSLDCRAGWVVGDGPEPDRDVMGEEEGVEEGRRGTGIHRVSERRGPC